MALYGEAIPDDTAPEPERPFMDAMSLFSAFFGDNAGPHNEAMFDNVRGVVHSGNDIELNFPSMYAVPCGEATLDYVEHVVPARSMYALPHGEATLDYVEHVVPGSHDTGSRFAVPPDEGNSKYVRDAVHGGDPAESKWTSIHACKDDVALFNYDEQVVHRDNIHAPSVEIGHALVASTFTNVHESNGLPVNASGNDRPIKKATSGELIKKATSGEILALVKHILASADSDALLQRTCEENTFLHLAAMYNNKQVVRQLISSKHLPSLISATNSRKETALMVAVKIGHISFASFLVELAIQHLQIHRSDSEVNQDLDTGNTLLGRMMLEKDNRGDNVLHHALRNGYRCLARELFFSEPKLSEQVNKLGVSPMYIATKKGFADIVEILLQHPGSKHDGPDGRTALHAAVRAGYTCIARNLLRERGDQLADVKNNSKNTPLHNAIRAHKSEMVRILLEYDPSLAYSEDEIKYSAFACAAHHGHVCIAKEVLRLCPIDIAYTLDKDGCNALHVAVIKEQTEFVKFILDTPQLQGLLNQTDDNGCTALHHAADNGNPDIIRALLDSKAVDCDVPSKDGRLPGDIMLEKKKEAKTIKWNEAYALIYKKSSLHIQNVVLGAAERKLNQAAEGDIRERTKTYTSNTTIVSALIATITFAAAFTVPGGYSSDPGDKGLPILARKLAFKAFLVFDTLAMCSSLGVSFLCLLVIMEDNYYLEYYRKWTGRLMSVAYGATTLTFATGLFTVVAPSSMGIATFILLLCIVVPFITYLLGRWPIIIRKLQLGSAFQPDLLFKI